MGTLVLKKGVNRRALGNGPGWVSGDHANLGVGGSATIVFDLGPEWYEYVIVAATLDWDSPSATGIIVQVGYSDDGAAYVRAPQAYGVSANHTAYSGTINGNVGPQSTVTRILGRYVHVVVGGVATAPLGPKPSAS